MVRPRTVSPQDNELIALGEEMVSWVENHPEILHLSEWWCLEKMILENVWETMINRATFVPYYEKALKTVGRKYLDKNSNVREGVSQRWQRVYFKDLKKEEDETTKFKADLAVTQMDAIPEDIRRGQDALMAQLKALQSSALNNALSNSKSEEKS